MTPEQTERLIAAAERIATAIESMAMDSKLQTRSNPVNAILRNHLPVLERVAARNRALRTPVPIDQAAKKIQRSVDWVREKSKTLKLNADALTAGDIPKLLNASLVRRPDVARRNKKAKGKARL